MKKYAFVCLFNCTWYQISEMPNGTISFLLGRRGTQKSVDLKIKGVHCPVFVWERL